MAIKTIQTPAGPMVIEIADDLLVECLVNGIPAYYDDSITCFFTQLPFALENIGFGYICMGLVLPIIIISLFGGIKENYRWFILYQAIWDFLVVYNFICNKPTLESLFWHYSAEEWNQGWDIKK
uniref:Uncharacterized protein n=1 Tax=Panagrolaimus davidi TaxID=227884 RepID=A0A914PGI5_9BILA